MIVKARIIGVYCPESHQNEKCNVAATTMELDKDVMAFTGRLRHCVTVQIIMERGGGTKRGDGDRWDDGTPPGVVQLTGWWWGYLRTSSPLTPLYPSLPLSPAPPSHRQVGTYSGNHVVSEAVRQVGRWSRRQVVISEGGRELGGQVGRWSLVRGAGS